MSDTALSPSRHLVDPELLEMLALFPAMELNRSTLPAIRAAPPRFDLGRVDPRDGVRLEKRLIPGSPESPSVPVLIYTPPRTGIMSAILHIHGGGYVTGNAEFMEPWHRRLVLETGAVIVSVNYRLAPETPFPGSVEDCYAALAFLHREAGQLSVDSARIGVMGESAGGGLAASLALLARDREEFKLRFQHLIYPMIDDRTCVRSDLSPTVGEFLWTREFNCFGWEALLGGSPGGEGVSPYAAAARAADVSRLPATFIATGALDLFVDENIVYARRLVEAGVPTELHVYPGAYHAFDVEPTAKIAEAARRDSLAALRRAL
jgi:acetyl esterase/lipase